MGLGKTLHVVYILKDGKLQKKVTLPSRKTAPRQMKPKNKELINSWQDS